jgi:Sec-independent protein translocase protein TatA
MNKYAVGGIAVLVVILIAAVFFAMNQLPKTGTESNNAVGNETAPDVSTPLDTSSQSLDQDLTTVASDTQLDPQQEILDV